MVPLIFLRYVTRRHAYARMERSPVIRKSYRWLKFAPDRRSSAAMAFADGGDFKRGAIN